MRFYPYPECPLRSVTSHPWGALLLLVVTYENIIRFICDPLSSAVEICEAPSPDSLMGFDVRKGGCSNRAPPFPPPLPPSYSSHHVVWLISLFISHTHTPLLCDPPCHPGDSLSIPLSIHPAHCAGTRRHNNPPPAAPPALTGILSDFLLVKPVFCELIVALEEMFGLVWGFFF